MGCEARKTMEEHGEVTGCLKQNKTLDSVGRDSNPEAPPACDQFGVVNRRLLWVFEHITSSNDSDIATQADNLFTEFSRVALPDECEVCDGMTLATYSKLKLFIQRTIKNKKRRRATSEEERSGLKKLARMFYVHTRDAERSWRGEGAPYGGNSAEKYWIRDNDVPHGSTTPE